MEQSIPLNEAQKVALDKLTVALGPEYVEFLAAQCPDVLHARVETFMQYETALLGQVQSQVASAMPTRFVAMPDEEVKHRPLSVDVKHFSGKEGENLTLWIREMEMATRSGLISVEHRRVSLAISISSYVQVIYNVWKGKLRKLAHRVFLILNLLMRLGCTCAKVDGSKGNVYIYIVLTILTSRYFNTNRNGSTT